ncbi:hypothetical protein [Kushneria indalinina]|uniref:Uncharacterized protein n=1 Tax=Kushneria indalinina DSM 14324 TaxID=1122140 RepID=A0A3D9DSJ9_9GAMM|nr:hypothetical protein [Kushneria indalinina]REC93384.1 hypothetical protein C8D72_3429 [Kushneria indalinina DSM 14324]
MAMNDQLMEPAFSALTESQLHTIEDLLSNDESSSDEELIEFFISEGIPEASARQALAWRDRYLTTIYLNGHTPIHLERDAWRYDPQAHQFVPV